MNQETNVSRAEPVTIRFDDELAGGAPFGVQELVSALARRWLLVLAATIAVTLLTIGITFLMTPQYVAVAKLAIDPTQRSVTDDSNARASSAQIEQSRVDTEVAAMQSREIAEQVIADLNLAADPEFVATSAKARSPAEAMGEAVTSFAKQVTIDREPNSYVVTISAKSQDPRKAAAIANDLVRRYNQSSVGQRNGQAVQQSQFLDQRLKGLGGEIQALESQAAKYRAQSGISEGGVGATVTDQQIGPITTQLAQAEAELAVAKANLEAGRQQLDRGNVSSVSSVISSPLISDLRRQRADAAQQKAQVDARYGARHPEAIRAAQQLGNIDQSIETEERRIVSGLEQNARTAQASVDSLRANLGTLRGRQATDSQASVLADALDRQAKAKQAIYDQLVQTEQRAGVAGSFGGSNATLVEAAAAPVEPSSPDRRLFAAIGAVLGFMLGVALALVVDFMTAVVRTGEDMERRLRVPYIVSVPQLSSSQLRAFDDPESAVAKFVVANPISPYAEALRTVRNTLLLHKSGARVISILSSLPMEGKTTTSITLGRVMALSGDRVVLVDCDLRRGGLKGIARATDSGGLIAVLEGKASAASAIVRDSETNLDILPLEAQSLTPVDLFSGERMKDLLKQLSADYDWVLLDTAPVLAVADSRILASLSDGSIFVVRADKTPLHAVRAALGLLRSDGSKVVGGVLSMVSVARRLGKRDPAYYYANYRGYQGG